MKGNRNDATSYNDLCKIFEQVSRLESAIYLLEWDSVTKIPLNGVKDRANVLSTLNMMKYSMLTSTETSKLLKNVNKPSSKLSKPQKRNISLMNNKHTYASANPISLIQEIEQERILCHEKWMLARKNNKFKEVAPYLKKLVSLTRRFAVNYSESLKKTISPYSTLMHHFEEGIKSDIFDNLIDNDLKTFILEISPKTKKIKLPKSKASMTMEKQELLSSAIIQSMELPQDSLRIDIATHPQIAPIANNNDIRLVLKDFSTYPPDIFIKVLMHELGHVTYNSRLPETDESLIINNSLGMLMHESVAILFETFITTSPQFIQYIQQYYKNILKLKGKSVETANLLNVFNQINSSLNRMDVDKLHYHLHIILRKQLEYQMLSNPAFVDDLPSEWNKLCKKFFSKEPQDDLSGCLQDIHWYKGYFGYFPMYSLATLVAAQIFETIIVKDSALMKNLQNGNFQPLLKILEDNIFSKASSVSALDLIKDITGKELGTESYKKYIIEKYVEN